jgi:hypothetical protein
MGDCGKLPDPVSATHQKYPAAFFGAVVRTVEWYRHTKERPTAASIPWRDYLTRRIFALTCTILMISWFF